LLKSVVYYFKVVNFSQPHSHSKPAQFYGKDAKVVLSKRYKGHNAKHV